MACFICVMPGRVVLCGVMALMELLERPRTVRHYNAALPGPAHHDRAAGEGRCVVPAPWHIVRHASRVPLVRCSSPGTHRRLSSRRSRRSVRTKVIAIQLVVRHQSWPSMHSHLTRSASQFTRLFLLVRERCRPAWPSWDQLTIIIMWPLMTYNLQTLIFYKY